MARPKKYDESTRTSLILAAAETIAESGVEALALRPLAQRCDCTTSTIYGLFGGREQLIAAVTGYVLASFTETQRAVPRTDDPITDLHGLGIAYRSWAMANPAFYAVMFGATGMGEECIPSAARPDDSIEPLTDAVSRAVAAGLIGGAPVEQIVTSIWAGVHGWVTLEIAGMTPQGPRRSVTAYSRHAESLLRAWRPGS